MSSFLSSTQQTLVDRLADVTDDVEARMMLGTVGVFASDRQIGILDDEALYLRTDESNRATFEEKGATPYNGGDGVAQVSYFQVPSPILDNDDALSAWVSHALDVSD